MPYKLNDKTILITGATSGIRGRKFDVLCALIALLYIPNAYLIYHIMGTEFTEQFFAHHGIYTNALPAIGMIAVFVLPFLVLFIIPALAAITFLCGLMSTYLIIMLRLKNKLFCIACGVTSGILINVLAWLFYTSSIKHPSMLTDFLSYSLTVPILLIGGPIMLVMISAINAYCIFVNVIKPRESLQPV